MLNRGTILTLGGLIVITGLGYFLFNNYFSSSAVAKANEEEKQEDKGPREGSIGTLERNEFQENTIGTIFANYLLNHKGEEEKWNIKHGKLNTKKPKNQLIASALTGLTTGEIKIKNICAEIYTSLKKDWGNPKPTYNWTQEDIKNMWDEAWIYCSAKEDDNKPEGWPYKDGKNL